VIEVTFASRLAGTAVVAAVLATGLASPAVAAPAGPASMKVRAAAETVTQAQWLSDVSTAIDPAFAYIGQRAAQSAGQKLAIVLDIDNTSIQTYFHPITEPAVPQTLQLADYAQSLGVSVIFVTARPDIIEPITRFTLEKAGYTVDGLYTRDLWELTESDQTFKTDARIAIENQGYTIIANIGNNVSDLAGGHAEQTFKLPDYNGLLS
jgi:hypothetical protein